MAARYRDTIATMAEQERTESAGHFEMLWDCEFCETKGLLAKSQRHCPECGGKQNADKRYFPPEGQEVRVDGHKYEGSDRYCPACNNPQGAAGKNCANCGSPMDGSAEVKGVAAPVAEPPKKKSKLWVIIVIAVVIVAIVGIVLGVRHCNRTKEASGKILAHKWERLVPIEVYDDIKLEAWRNEVPATARMVVCHRAVRSHKKVPDGEDCREEKKDKKDGTFEKIRKCTPKFRSEPVEDDKCSFVVTDWHKIEEAVAKGAGMTLADPPGLPPAAVAPVPRARRAGHKQDSFFLDIEVPGIKPQSCKVSNDVWKKYADGAVVKLEVKVRNDAIDCDSL
jgi:hypothetical protein